MVKRLAQTPKSVRLGEQVANLLLAAIRLQEYLPGQRLPSERELCLRLGVNRMAVREGLRWLEHQQYIEIRRGRYGGAFVRTPATELTLERLRGKAEQLRQLFEYRAAIEPFFTGELDTSGVPRCALFLFENTLPDGSPKMETTAAFGRLIRLAQQGPGVLQQPLFRIRCLNAAGMYFLVELDDGVVRPRLPEPPVRRIADNREQPGARVAATEAVGVLKCS